MLYIPRWLLAITLYVLIIYLIISLQPSLMFDAYGKPKDFGIGTTDGKSVLAPAFVFPILALISYFIASMVQFVFV